MLTMYSITKGREYVVIMDRAEDVLIHNDNYTMTWYPIVNFNTKDGIRNETITEILK